VARNDASDGNPLGNDNAASATVVGKADNTEQENNDCSGDNRDNDKDKDN
jgi:hypothetical protein